jgi:hypothetical protein
MLERKVYEAGQLIVGRISGVVKAQTFINSTFWQIDSKNIGELKKDYSQLYYDTEIKRVELSAKDVIKMAEINSGIAVNLERYRTALVIRDKRLIELAKMHQEISQKLNYQVKVFNNVVQGFAWLGYKNPDHENIK